MKLKYLIYLNSIMLLNELFLFEQQLADMQVAFIHPQQRRIMTLPKSASPDRKSPYHLELIAKQPEAYGIDPKELEQDIDKYHSSWRTPEQIQALSPQERMYDWADATDDVFSWAHEIAYKNGWVRWRASKGLISLSGDLEPVKAALSMPQVVQAIRSQPGIIVNLDYNVPMGLQLWIRKEINHPVELNQLRREMDKLNDKKEIESIELQKQIDAARAMGAKV